MSPTTVFIDLDGVLALGRRDANGLPELEPALVQRLNRVAGIHPDTQIVMSSSWRRHIPDLPAYGKRNGITAPLVGGIPGLEVVVHGQMSLDTASSWTRSHQVYLWLLQHWPVLRFVIFDDWPMHTLSPWAIRTDPRVGLSDRDAEVAIEILNGGWQPATERKGP